MASNKEPLTILLLGTTGNGKSATGNTLVGRSCFKEAAGMAHVTNITQSEEAFTEEFHVTVIDTPGFFDAEGYDHDDVDYQKLTDDAEHTRKQRRNYQRHYFHQDLSKGESVLKQHDDKIKSIEDVLKQKREDWRAEQVKRSIIASCFSGGIHAFLLVINAEGRFSDNDREMLAFFDRKYGGTSVFDYTFVLFTRADYIWKESGRSNEERTPRMEKDALDYFLKNGSVAKVRCFQDFLEEINGRVLYINNREAREHGESYYQWNSIFKDIHHHVKVNCGGKPFTSIQFQACRDNLRNEVLDMMPHLRAPQQKLEEVSRKLDEDRAKEKVLTESIRITADCSFQEPLSAPLEEEGKPKLSSQGSTVETEWMSEEDLKELRELQDSIRVQEEEMQKLDRLCQKAEERLGHFTLEFRDMLLRDTRWKRRSQEFKGFLKGLFILRPLEQQKAAGNRALQKLELQAKTEATIKLKEEYPELSYAHHWLKEENLKQTFLQNMENQKDILKKGYDKGLKPVKQGVQKLGKIFHPPEQRTDSAMIQNQKEHEHHQLQQSFPEQVRPDFGSLPTHKHDRMGESAAYSANTSSLYGAMHGDHDYDELYTFCSTVDFDGYAYWEPCL